jgi:glycerol-1-phosphate dehydrogenase [NAD(P)+]
VADWRRQAEAVLKPALAGSAAIREILLDEDALAAADAVFGRHFPGEPAIVVADGNTWAAAGAAVAARLAAGGVAVSHHILPASPRPKPSVELAETIAGAIRDAGAVPVAVGAGVINDLVKYAAFRLERRYMVAATAASMDGYTSDGAPLTDRGFKKTIPCRPPVAVLADLGVLAAAPKRMTGWGYGDLAGKVPAGADWLIADALGIEAVDAVAWPMVQADLRGWLGGAAALARGEPAAVAGLMTGLCVVGLAMEAYRGSRPASGADHQIAHVWEMEDHTYAGERAAHGACVAIGTMASLRLYDWLLRQDLSTLAAAAGGTAVPEAAIIAAFGQGDIARRAIAETAAKALDPAAHRMRRAEIARVWPGLVPRLRAQLLPPGEMAALLRQAGAPVEPAEIGIDGARLARTVLAARFIRSRYTVLDLLAETGLLERAVREALGP